MIGTAVASVRFVIFDFRTTRGRPRRIAMNRFFKRRETSRKRSANPKRTKKPIKKVGNAVMEIVGLVSLVFIAWVVFQGGDIESRNSNDRKLPIERTFSEMVEVARSENFLR